MGDARDAGEGIRPARLRGLREAWTVRRARLGLFALAVLSWLPLLAMPSQRWADFSAFYAAGKLALGPDVLSLPAILGYEAQHGLRSVAFLYPPGFALPYVPLAALPYDLAGAVHTGIEAAALLAAALLGARLYRIPTWWAVLGTFAWYPAAEGVVSGQNSALLLLLALIAASGLAAGRAWVAGISLGLAAYRPHLGLPLLAFAGWRRAWRAAAVTVLVIGLQYGLGVLASGGSWDWPIQWWRTVAGETNADFQAVGWQSLSLPGNLGRLSVLGSGQGSLFGPAIVGYAIGGLVILACLRPLRDWDAPRAMALACALALFAGPRGWLYDGTLLLPAIGVLAADAGALGWPHGRRWLLAAAYGLAMAWPIGLVTGITPLALEVCVAPFLLLGLGPFRSRPASELAAGDGSPAASPEQVPARA